MKHYKHKGMSSDSKSKGQNVGHAGSKCAEMIRQTGKLEKSVPHPKKSNKASF